MLAAVLFAVLPRRSARFALPALVGCVFLASQLAVFDTVRSYSRTLEDVARTGDPSWLDNRFGRDRTVGFIWTGALDPAILWQLEFWNRNLDPVYRLRLEPGNLPAAEATIDGPTGKLRIPPGFADPDALLSDSTLVLNEQPLSTFPSGLRVYEARPTTRITGSAEGVYADSWSGGRFLYTHYGCGPSGWLGLALASDPTLGLPSQTVVARTEGQEVASASVAPGEQVYLRIPVQGRDGRCTVQVNVSPTAVPAEVIPGSPDTRRLGLRFYRATYWPR